MRYASRDANLIAGSCGVCILIIRCAVDLIKTICYFLIAKQKVCILFMLDEEKRDDGNCG